MRTAVTVVALLASLVPAVAAGKNRVAAAADPKAIVTAIYEAALHPRKGDADWLDPAERGKTLTKSLTELWAASDAATDPGDAAPPDFDIVSDTNGMELATYKLTVEKLDQTSATVAVKLGYTTRDVTRPGDTIVRYDFVREDNKWKIDEIRSTWSLRNMLSPDPK